jgi:transcriptional regulator with XRE-family HTH domain
MLRMARRRAGLSQRELARRAGVPQATISRIENGVVSPTVDTLEPLIRACGMELEVLEPAGGGVDRSLLAERLRLSPVQRAASAAQAVEGLKRLRRAVGLPEVAPERAV